MTVALTGRYWLSAWALAIDHKLILLQLSGLHRG